MKKVVADDALNISNDVSSGQSKMDVAEIERAKSLLW